jgi:hypothetical protein
MGNILGCIAILLLIKTQWTQTQTTCCRLQTACECPDCLACKVQAFQRRVAELQGSLAVLAERCGSLEQVHEGHESRWK